jgi:hypothetical protein
MPKKDMDYSKCLIYKLVCNNLDVKDCYVGHTTNYKQRKGLHKSSCNNSNSKLYNLKVYQFIRENGGWTNWSMVLVENYPCNDVLEARARERYWFEILNANLNSEVPNRNQKEYYETNKEKIAEYYKEWNKVNKEHLAEYNKEYRETNKEKVVEYQKEWYKTNKERVLEKIKEYRENNKEQIKEQKAQLITCECGRKITKGHKARHCKSKIHLNYVSSSKNDGNEITPVIQFTSSKDNLIS